MTDAETNEFMEMIRESGNGRAVRALSRPRPAQTRPGPALTLRQAWGGRNPKRFPAAKGVIVYSARSRAIAQRTQRGSPVTASAHSSSATSPQAAARSSVLKLARAYSGMLIAGPLEETSPAPRPGSSGEGSDGLIRWKRRAAAPPRGWLRARRERRQHPVPLR